MNAKIFFSSLIIGLFAYVAFPLMIPVAMAAVFAVLFYPWQLRLENWKLSRSLASGVMTLGISLVILLPTVFLIFLGSKAAIDQLKLMKERPQGAASSSFFEGLVDLPVIQKGIGKITQWFPIPVEEVINFSESAIRGLAVRITDALGGLVSQLPGIVMGLAVMIVSIYFFLLDGSRLVRWIRDNSVFSVRQTEQLIHSFARMCRSVVLATVISGFAQSFIFSIATLIVGLHNVPLIGFVIFLASFVPLIGASPVTFGIAFYNLATGNTSAGVILLVAAVLTSLVDNFVRPAVLKGAGNLHPLLAFIAAFGGLQVMGFAGVFLGPIVATLMVVTIQNLVENRPSQRR